jgi:hypothetical protein
MTNDHTQQREPTRFGVDVVPPGDLRHIKPEAVVIASNQDLHVLRALQELLPESRFTEMHRFTHPIAFTYAEPATAPAPISEPARQLVASLSSGERR